jgi:hypothetical protein
MTQARPPEAGAGEDAAPQRIAELLNSTKGARRWVESFLDASAGSAQPLTPDHKKYLREVAARAKDTRADLDAISARIQSALAEAKTPAQKSSNGATVASGGAAAANA